MLNGKECPVLRPLCAEWLDMSGNALPTTHQPHAASPPLLDLLVSGMPRLHNAKVPAEPASALTAHSQGQAAMLCFVV